ncbi:ABC transporter substrate-binding protein [Actinomadura miaoliensis]|uniref:Leucine-binding protein domain-containing protein n=1 Tax=Actinomadura miaoliensis TaxID=430685 RepID=A0ABP7WTI9_9ACTN
MARLRVGACLSLTGRYARFGRQAAAALDVWRAADENADVLIEDDHSDRHRFRAAFRGLAGRCDVLLGPYSTDLMRAAGDIAADLDRLVWNHGGSGDDVETAHPGHVVSVPTPTSRYADPFLRHLATVRGSARLYVVQGKGGFGRQVANGAEAAARALGIDVARVGGLPELDESVRWNLLCAASFEEDVRTVTTAQALPNPPGTLCAVAAGVREFGDATDDPRGIYGVGQWSPGRAHEPELGLEETAFIAAFRRRTGIQPDYPAAQAYAAAVIAAHCLRAAGSPARRSVWAVATRLRTSTMFGAFAIDPSTGAQTAHEPVLVHWTPTGPQVVGG